MKVKVAQSVWLFATLFPLDQNTGVGSLSFLRGSTRPRDQTQVSYIAGRFLTSWAIGKPKQYREKNVFFSSLRTPDPFLLLKALDSLSTYLRINSLIRSPGWSFSCYAFSWLLPSQAWKDNSATTYLCQSLKIANLSSYWTCHSKSFLYWIMLTHWLCLSLIFWLSLTSLCLHEQGCARPLQSDSSQLHGL